MTIDEKINNPGRMQFRRYGLIGCCLLGLLFLGCAPNQNPNASKLLGTWQLMTEQEIDDSKAIGENELADKLARDSTRIDRTVTNGNLMTIEFLPNAQLRTTALQVKQGTWRYQSIDISTNTVTLECSLGREAPVDTKVRFVSDEIVCMIPPNISVLEKELLFRRVDSPAN